MNKSQLVISAVYFILTLMATFAVKAADILIVESYHADFYWDMEYKKGIADNLTSDYHFSYFQMDTKRLPVEKHLEMAELAWQKYLMLKPDIVVLADDNALKYLGPRLKNTSTPVVYLGINNNPRHYETYHAANITGVLERPLLKRSILYLKKLVNNVDKVLVLSDDTPSSKTAMGMEFESHNVIKLRGVIIEVARVTQFSHWQEKVLSAEANEIDFIVVGLYQNIRDENGSHVNADQVIEWTSANSDIPVFGFWDFSIGKNKAIGGLVIKGYEQGYTAAKIIKRIVAGENVAAIRPEVAKKGSYIFSREEVKKHNLIIPTDMNSAITWVK
jgi:ABC-type uncharacterized transport system substrate-binding protein